MEKYNTFKNEKTYSEFIKNIPLLLEYVKKILTADKLLFNEDEAEKVSLFVKENEISKENLYPLIAYFGESIIKRYGGNWFFTGNDDFAPNEASIGNSNAVLMRSCPSYYIHEIQKTGNIKLFNEDLKDNLKNKNEIKDLMQELFPKKKKK